MSAKLEPILTEDDLQAWSAILAGRYEDIPRARDRHFYREALKSLLREAGFRDFTANSEEESDFQLGVGIGAMLLTTQVHINLADDEDKEEYRESIEAALEEIDRPLTKEEFEDNMGLNEGNE